MRTALRWLSGLAVAGALAGCTVTSDSALSTSKTTDEKDRTEETAVVEVGHKVPDIDGEDIDRKNLKLSDYRGKVVLLDFWGNW
jgi:cytochrome oxidase Cu insertion factor (SCO1/SenC/PrrC family)